MHIKQIIVNGFKSFSNKEIINFSKGICALVGPNGSGKSNIIDAIKWAIGEQRVSELRGERLEDLIFNGSQKFKPQNFSEVELCFDNSEKKIAVNYDNLSIMRRMYRSGESEFFINKQSCRLKDIQDMFLNSGLGKSSYSIIPQGKIDQILSEKVEEKRKFFEEAAAISKFRERKKECDVKIFRAKDNLLRVDDLLKQSYRRCNQLSKQSGDTAKYFELNDQIKKTKLNLLLHKLFLNQEEVNFVQRHVIENKEKIHALSDKLQKVKKNIESLSSSLSSDNRDINDLEKERIKNEQKKESLLQEKNWYEGGTVDLERSLKVSDDTLIRLEKEIELNQRRTEQNLQQVSVSKQKIIKIDQEIEKLKKKLSTVDESLKTLDKENEILFEILAKKEKDRLQINDTEKKILLKLIEEIDFLKKDLEKKNIIASRDVFSKKINALIKDIKSINTDRLSDPQMIDKIIEIKKRTSLDGSFYKNFFEEEKSFYTFFFSAEGTYSTKEKLSQELVVIIEEIKTTRKRISKNQNSIQEMRVEGEELTRKVEQGKFSLSGYEQNVIALEKNIEDKKQIIYSVKDMLKKNTSEKEFNIKKKNELIQKISNNDIQLQQLDKANREIEKKINNFFQQQKDKKDKFEQGIKQETQLQKDIENIQKKNYEYSTKIQVLEGVQESLYEKGSYQCAVDLRQYNLKKLSHIESENQKLQQLEKDLQSLGSVNPLAKEEFDETSLQIKEVEEQKSDILESIADLEKVSQETVNECKKIFLETFEEVNKNFSMLIKELFPGGEGAIRLSTEDDPLEADISIIVQPEGKKLQKLNLFSGGERSLIVLAFIFAFFLRKPSPFCLLDEVDAALDSSNIERFMRLLNKMQKYTQLILISHNQKTMQIVDYIYGFSIKDGVTKILSLKV